MLPIVMVLSRAEEDTQFTAAAAVVVATTTSVEKLVLHFIRAVAAAAVVLAIPIILSPVVLFWEKWKKKLKTTRYLKWREMTILPHQVS